MFSFISNCCELAACGQCDSLFCSPTSDEVRFIWGRKLSSATIIFLLNRYVVFAFGIVTILGAFPWNTNLVCFIFFHMSRRLKFRPHSCEVIVLLYDITTLMFSLAFSALRVYAVGVNKWLPTLLTLLFGLVPFGTNLFDAIRTSRAFVAFVDEFPVCTYNEYYSNNTHLKLSISTRTCAIISDAIVLAVTWSNTYSITKAAERANINASLATMVLRDGTIYSMSVACFLMPECYRSDNIV